MLSAQNAHAMLTYRKGKGMFKNPLVGGGGDFITPYWFSLNNSEAVKAVTLAFSSI